MMPVCLNWKLERSEQAWNRQGTDREQRLNGETKGEQKQNAPGTPPATGTSPYGRDPRLIYIHIMSLKRLANFSKQPTLFHTPRPLNSLILFC